LTPAFLKALMEGLVKDEYHGLAGKDTLTPRGLPRSDTCRPINRHISTKLSIVDFQYISIAVLSL